LLVVGVELRLVQSQKKRASGFCGHSLLGVSQLKLAPELRAFGTVGQDPRSEIIVVDEILNGVMLVIFQWQKHTERLERLWL